MTDIYGFCEVSCNKKMFFFCKFCSIPFTDLRDVKTHEKICQKSEDRSVKLLLPLLLLSLLLLFDEIIEN